MKWTLLLALVSIGLVAGDGGAWKENYEYKYKLVQKTFSKLPGENDRGIVASVCLTIRPQADNTWIGQITEKELSDLGKQDNGSSDMAEKKSNFQDVPLNKLFKVYLKNGVIDTLSVDQTMTEKQINLVKLIVSAFQVDTEGQNLMRESANNPRPDMDTNNVYYMTMEPTTIGVCKTSYDISRLPEYLAYAQYDTIPSLSKYAGEGVVIQIIKHQNYNKCNNEQSDYVADRDALDTVSDLISTRIIISGSLDKYTIHSSVSSFTNEKTRNYFYVTLESMERNYEDRRFSPRFEVMDNFGSMDNIRSMENIGSMEKVSNMQNDGNMKNVGNLAQHMY